MRSPEACVIKTDGVNCDTEMMHAFSVAGAMPELVHVNELQHGKRRLGDYQILALAGGFSYGDDIASGKVLANELDSHLSDQVQGFVADGKPVIGVCNGFQVLVRAGLLPDTELGRQKITLAQNDTGHFECRWIDLKPESNICQFVQPKDFEEQPVPMQVAHGEGRVLGPVKAINDLYYFGQIVFSYVDRDSINSVDYPANPNGSMCNIAGITDRSGLILGMMPHPERSIEAFHPDRQRTPAAKAAGKVIFENIVNYARGM